MIKLTADEKRIRVNEYQRGWRKRNPAKVNLVNKNWYTDIRLKVIESYGNKCFCCTESELRFLTIDHIANDGNIERKSGLKTSRLFSKINTGKVSRDNYQVLCYNCNMGRALSEDYMCPHNLA